MFASRNKRFDLILRPWNVNGAGFFDTFRNGEVEIGVDLDDIKEVFNYCDELIFNTLCNKKIM